MTENPMGNTENTEASATPELKLTGDLRMTKQRREVYDVLMSKRDHPTATEVFMRAKEHMPSISLATVYNCLETLVQCGLVKQVNVDREPSRYCGNMTDHGHFHCDECGAVTDLDLRREAEPKEYLKLPRGSVVEKFEMAARGLCPDCAKAAKAKK